MKNTTPIISEKSIERIVLYHSLLRKLADRKMQSVFSHELARLARVSPAQVRRDLMAVGISGNPNFGYRVDELADGIEKLVSAPGGEHAFLVGVGNLGRAILSYFFSGGPRFSIVAAFDANPERANRIISGCRCYPIQELKSISQQHRPMIGIITVPPAAAQEVAIRLVEVGVRAIINFAPLRLDLPSNVFVEDLDIATVFEKVAFFARQPRKGENRL